jgi:hypothetical protein
VSGAYVSAQLDGQPRDAANGSLIISRGWADVRSGYGTMVAAAEGIGAGQLRSGIYINAPAPQVAIPAAVAAALGETGSRSIKIPDLPLDPLPVHSLTRQIEITGILHVTRTDASPIALLQGTARGILFRFENRIHVAEIGQPIVDEDGNPVERLRNWKLACLNGKMALLTGPDGNAVLRLDKKTGQ